ncbi:DsbA family protein [Nitrosophilus kaiyonis]|uniref:DsbA family protein n=1 Tax=Nitrosophilus kaiyonis TaxID=2930200 RepID=UPI0024912869|nr:thioredoxin domain-containing protein [Nitrosophilus kaiyonis]
MSSMLRLLSISTALAIFSFGATDAQIIKFVKRGLSKNPSLKVNSVKIVDKQILDKPKGWQAYFIKFNLTLKRGNKNINISQSDIIFAKDGYISPDFINIKTNRSIKHDLSPKVDESFYDDKHLLLGNKNAKHKILIFSDPNCPFCKEIVPEVIEIVSKYPEIFALYYYHLPLLKLHPGSLTLCKAMILLQKDKKVDLIKKIYEVDFDYEEKDEKKVLDELNKKLGLNLTLKDINQEWVKKELENDMKRAEDLLVNGTPTMFLDGKKDPSREKYKDFIPKKK